MQGMVFDFFSQIHPIKVFVNLKSVGPKEVGVFKMKEVIVLKEKTFGS